MMPRRPGCHERLHHFSTVFLTDIPECDSCPAKASVRSPFPASAYPLAIPPSTRHRRMITGEINGLHTHGTLSGVSVRISVPEVANSLKTFNPKLGITGNSLSSVLPASSVLLLRGFCQLHTQRSVARALDARNSLSTPEPRAKITSAPAFPPPTASLRTLRQLYRRYPPSCRRGRHHHLTMGIMIGKAVRTSLPRDIWTRIAATSS